MERKTTMQFKDSELSDIIRMLYWALGEYSEEENDFEEYTRIAQRFEKSQARLNKVKFDKNNSYFG